MSHTFIVGDLVRCIDDSGYQFISKGKVYTVIGTFNNQGSFIQISPSGYAYAHTRFELVQPEPLDNHGEPIDYSNTTTLEEPPVEDFVGRKKTPVEIALEGHNGPGQQAIAKAGVELTTLLLKKNTDYGNSAMTPPILAPSMSAREAIQCRMSDKIRRLERLLAGNTAEVNESIEDTISDLGGYSILWLACED